MKTTTIFKVGNAHRRPDGSIQLWTTNDKGQHFQTLEMVEAYIDNLLSGYRERDQPMPPNEFVPIEITTTIHDV